MLTLRRIGGLGATGFRVAQSSSCLLSGKYSQSQRNLTTKTLEIVGATLPAVGEAGPAFTAHFYKRLFKAHPDLLNTFNVTNQKQGRQQKALFSAVAASASSVLDHGTLPTDLLEGLNHKHCALNVIPAQYDVVGEHILGTISDMLNPGQEVLDAWGELYGALAGHCVEREEQIYAAVEAVPGGWRGPRKFKVVGKVAQSSHITQFSFEPVDGKPVASFLPGQYTTVWLHPEGTDYRQPRHYSLTNQPGEAGYSIAVKKEEHGLISSYLHEKVQVGDTLDLSPPFGNFNMSGCEQLWTDSPDSPVVFMSAGVGITPVLGMLGTLKSGTTPQSRPVMWLHAAKNGKEHAFRDYLVGLARAHPDDLTRRVWYSEPHADDVIGASNKSHFHFKGRMELDQVKNILPIGDSKAQYFFCGPVPWMQSVGKQLVDVGIPKSSLHFEAFGPAEDILG